MSTLPALLSSPGADRSPRFIDSESNLDAALTRLTSTLPSNPRVFYPEAVKLGIVALLGELLAHENTDIALDVVQVLVELTDEDAEQEAEDEDEDDEDEQQGRGGMGVLIRALVSLAATGALLERGVRC